MLRLHVHCSLNLTPSCARQVQFASGSYGSWWVINKPSSTKKLLREIPLKALKDETNGGGGGSVPPGRSWEPGLEIAVPFEQRPVNEYSSLKDGPLYSWGDLGPGELFLRLGSLWFVTFTVLGVPIAAASFNPAREPLRFVLAAGTGTLFIVSLIILRIYLVLARDRLLGSYKVKPVVKLLKQTLVGTGVLLVSSVMLFIFATPVEDFFKSTFTPKESPSAVAPASKMNSKFNIKKEELLRLPMEVKTEDDLAAAAAEAADGRPVYCRDRFYRALAGGQYCKWEDLIK
ncbi:hypothetical protein EUGRSUZ_H02280 [Eucalyptus grandis]|uniref:Uncharacterized protein n=2 Tax=Eucalyptus grandis TaxID=71139 RepID=A0A059B0X3_EUCGR|nr:hypothetical protein EUGRSUZ_H02280 [Eucalyptus grandis]